METVPVVPPITATAMAGAITLMATSGAVSVMAHPVGRIAIKCKRYKWLKREL